ncbi:MAG: hypothetical protein ABIC91_05220 [Nanoarchaeota archaeon]|nr:hypothetical protein [Nanoarchaeota archaeon]MBU1030782.1 hypothetical protein [Nanoarchaeota archaeon]MBU1849974.1 hypothetical protein [Nanoarchaeota archaeon]
MSEEKQKSELELLLEKNIKTNLSKKEYKRALELISNPVYSEDDYCWTCSLSNQETEIKAIYDTKLCPAHAHYVLISRK